MCSTIYVLTINSLLHKRVCHTEFTKRVIDFFVFPERVRGKYI